VITQESSWCVLGTALLAMVSTDVPRAFERSRLSRLTVHLQQPGAFGHDYSTGRAGLRTANTPRQL